MDRYVTRLCWNDCDWKRPCGKASGSSYVDEKGFGYEEWLNSDQVALDGRRYAFIQGVSRSHRRLEGKEIALDLYSISLAGSAFVVARISKAHVLSAAEAEEATRGLRGAEVLTNMRQQVKDVGGDPSAFAGEGVVNISFKKEDLTMLPQWHPIDRHVLKGRFRYQLYSATGWPESILRGPASPKVTTAIRRAISTEARELALVENQMQNEVFALLQQQFGKSSLHRERDHVDIMVTNKHGAAEYLIEVKAHADPRIAMRQALGQILEYAHFPGAKETYSGAKLVVIGPSAPTAPVVEYVHELNRRYTLPVAYRQYEPGTDRFAL